MIENAGREHYMDGYLNSDLVHVTHEGHFDYDWVQTHIWYSPSHRRYYWHSESGCSCNSFGDYVNTIDDMESGTKADCLRALQRLKALPETKLHVRNHRP